MSPPQGGPGVEPRWATFMGPEGSFVVLRDKQAIEDVIAMLRAIQRRAPGEVDRGSDPRGMSISEQVEEFGRVLDG